MPQLTDARIPARPRVRRTPRALLAAAALASGLAGVAAPPADAAPGTVRMLKATPTVQVLSAARRTTETKKSKKVTIRTFRATRVTRRRAKFRVTGLRKKTIRKVELRMRRKRLKVSPEALKNAVSTGGTSVEVQAPATIVPSGPAAAPVLVVEVARSPAPTEPKPPVPATIAGRPSGDWRPYSDASPFNRTLPGAPRVAPNSSAMVSEVLSHGPADSLITVDGTGDSASSDYSRPMFWSSPSDPLYTVRCTQYGGDCPISGKTLRIPAGARAAGGTDGHLTVIDPATNAEWSFFAVESKPAGGGELRVGWGRSCSLTGDGTKCGGGAAEFGGLAGRIRWEELALAMQNRTGLRHALFMTVNCSRPGTFVYPATKDEGSGACATSNAPEMGRQFWLDMSPQEINALQVPEWRKVIARTLATYGAYVGDQGGTSFGFQFESGQSYLSLGVANPFVTFAKANPDGIVADGGVNYFKLRDGIPWASRLRALDVTQS